jgi:hypothetical protein
MRRRGNATAPTADVVTHVELQHIVYPPMAGTAAREHAGTLFIVVKSITL